MNTDHSIAHALAVALVLSTGTGCRGKSDEDTTPKLEAVDVAPSLQIETADDPQEAKRPPELVGVLPEDFPNDLPLLLPASLVDFGNRNGSHYVRLLTSAAPKIAERELGNLVRSAGWSLTDSGNGKLLRKGSKEVRLRFENARPGTFYDLEY